MIKIQGNIYIFFVWKKKTKVDDKYGKSQTMIVPAADAALAVANSPA